MKLTKCNYNNVKSIIDRHEKYRNSYWWSYDNGNAATRARRAFSLEFNFKRNGHVYRVWQNMHQSRKNTYYKMVVEVDGKDKDVRALKTLLKHLKQPIGEWRQPTGAVYENHNLVAHIY